MVVYYELSELGYKNSEVFLIKIETITISLSKDAFFLFKTRANKHNQEISIEISNYLEKEAEFLENQPFHEAIS